MGTDALSGGQPMVIPLRDGGELRVDAEGVHVGGTLYRLEQIQDARQVSPNPETIGLRVDGVGLVTVMPARPGDTAAALEALFRLRPGLRPAGFGPTGVGGPPAGAWPYGPPPGYGYPPPPYGAPPGYAPVPGYPPPPGPGGPVGYSGYPPPPGYGYPPPYPGYAVVPRLSGQPAGAQEGDPYGGPHRPGVGPWPQGIGDVLGTTFRLFFHRYWRLGLGVALVPGLLIGGLGVALAWAEGLDPTKGLLQQAFTNVTLPGSGNLPNSPIVQWLQTPPDPTQIALLVGIGLLLFVLGLVVSSWQTALLAWGAREALRGQPVRIGRAMRMGLGRTPKVLGATLLVALIGLALAAVAGAPLVLSVVVTVGLAVNGGGDSAAVAAVLGICFGMLIYFALVVGVIYISVRLGLAPYAAACDGLSPGKAIGWSWSLTARNWWRTFVPLLVVGMAVVPVAMVASSAEFVSLIAFYLVALPLILALTASLTAMASVVVYYDLRLRREGFPTLARELALPGFAPGPPGPAGPVGPATGPAAGAAPEQPPLG